MAEVGDIELRALLGMRGRPGRIFLAGLLATITMYMVVPFGDVPPAQAAAALAVLLGAGTAVLLVPGEPLPWPATALVLAAGPVAVTLTHLDLREEALRQPWAVLLATSYVLAVLALRGRVLVAWAGAAAVAVTIAVLDLVPGVRIGPLPTAIAAVATLAGTTVCALILRPTQRSLRLLRDEAAMRAGAEAAISAEHSERVRQLGRLDEVAGPMLERIARGVELASADREECRLLEAALRDGLRAPQLVTDQVNAAARGARSRGVEVLLLDDGGFVGVAAAVRDRVLELAVRDLDAANAGSVTVRVLPAGRGTVATVLASDADGDQRTEISSTGEVLIRS